MTWEAKGVQRLLFRKDDGGWYWTRRGEFVYTIIARVRTWLERQR